MAQEIESRHSSSSSSTCVHFAHMLDRHFISCNGNFRESFISILRSTCVHAGVCACICACVFVSECAYMSVRIYTECNQEYILIILAFFIELFVLHENLHNSEWKIWPQSSLSLSRSVPMSPSLNLCLSVFCPFVSFFVCLFVSLPPCLLLCLSFSLFLFYSVYFSSRPSIHLSVGLSVCIYLT